MSFGSLGMARSAPATDLLLPLLFAVLLHATQGQQGVQLIYHEKIEVTEGQDAALPCILRNNTSQFSVVNMEWKKGRENATQLLVYNPQFSTVYHWSNITLRVDTSSMDSHLILRGVTSWDGGIYICVLSTFPWGNVIRETELKIRDPSVDVACDAESPLEVEAGGNVSIRCKATTGSLYMWTKGSSPVSENSDLNLWRVTEADAGLYNLTVYKGNQEDKRSQHRLFLISVLQATTRRADPRPVLSASTSEGTAAAAHLTMLTPAEDLFTVDMTQTVTTAADITNNFRSLDVTASKDVTSRPHDTRPSATSSPPAHTESPPPHLTSDWQINQTLTLGSSPPSSNPSAGDTTFLFTSSQTEPEDITSSSPERSTRLDFTSDSVVFEEPDPDGSQNHLLLLLMILPLLILIAVVSVHCRRQIIKQRMDLPPPFKPPPPPVKYTSARCRDVVSESAAWYDGTII